MPARVASSAWVRPLAARTAAIVRPRSAGLRTAQIRERYSLLRLFAYPGCSRHLR
jgi:hypothetical protein